MYKVLYIRRHRKASYRVVAEGLSPVLKRHRVFLKICNSIESFGASHNIDCISPGGSYQYKETIFAIFLKKKQDTFSRPKLGFVAKNF